MKYITKNVKMMKISLLSLLVMMSVVAFSQESIKPLKSFIPAKVLIDPLSHQSVDASNQSSTSETRSYNIGDRSITMIPIGESTNVYSMGYNGRTHIWADQNLNSVVFAHRMLNDADTYGNARVAYDISTEGGVDGSWTNNVQVYEPLGPGDEYPEAAGRFPQGAIVNPVGNTNPDDAFFTYYLTTLDGSNGESIWGGTAYGVNGLTDVNPSAPTQVNNTTSGDTYHYITDALTVTQQGVVWVVEPSSPIDGDNVGYSGQLIVNRGEVNDDNEIQYEEWLMDVFTEEDGISDTKVAFAPDGQTGYILVLADAVTDPVPATSYHPVLYETLDGGETWAESPNHCQLGGVDGQDAIKEFIPDEVLDAQYPDGWDRDEIIYNMGYQADMVVDKYGNAHIVGYVACGNESGWYPYSELGATFHLIYDRESEDWVCTLLHRNYSNIEGMLGGEGGIPQYNRPQAASDISGRCLIFSWSDTDLEDEEENLNPDIYCMGYNVEDDLYLSNEYGQADKVTQFTQAMYSAYYATMPHYVFSEGNSSQVDCFIPFVYADLGNDIDYLGDVQYMYIDGWEYNFIFGDVADNNEAHTKVKQNYPNPVSSSTTVEVEVYSSASLSIEVTNLVGQVIYSEDKGVVGYGDYEFNIDASNYTSGVYFYTVRTNNSTITKKMIVE